jgi:hypothetical protein
MGSGAVRLTVNLAVGDVCCHSKAISSVPFAVAVKLLGAVVLLGVGVEVGATGSSLADEKELHPAKPQSSTIGTRINGTRKMRISHSIYIERCARPAP